MLHLAAQHGGVEMAVVGHLEPWRFVFVMVGLPGLLFCFMVFLFPEPARKRESAGVRTATTGEVAGFLRARWQLWASLILAVGSMNMALNSSIAWQTVYLDRRFGLAPVNSGPRIGFMLLVVGILGQLLAGRIADRWFARGRLDAHVRYYVFGLPLLAPAAVAMFLVPSVLWYFILGIALYGFMLTFMGCSVAVVQITSPSDMCGRLVAVLLLTTNAIGLVLGPPTVALLSQHVFQGPEGLGRALASVIGGAAVTAFLGFSACGRYIRQVMAAGREQAGAMPAMAG
jgi:hypothetical protein